MQPLSEFYYIYIYITKKMCLLHSFLIKYYKIKFYKYKKSYPDYRIGPVKVKTKGDHSS